MCVIQAAEKKEGIVSKFRNGDVVFIQGRTWRSFFVMLTDGGRTSAAADESFSHVGVVRFISDIPHVVHATPDNLFVLAEPADAFISSDNAECSAIYRLTDEGAQTAVSEAASLAALEYYTLSVPFDHQFDVCDATSLYCTELVLRAYEKAGVDLSEGRADFLCKVPLYGEVLLPDSLRRSGMLTRVETN
ncbi:MAG: hypothetical protein LBO21_10985 [Synergistaceae bacterium]|jgi:hypothetical protein|nr:hypothetical protein [Synergistaceae bacterium]